MYKKDETEKQGRKIACVNKKNCDKRQNSENIGRKMCGKKSRKYLID